MPFPNFYLRLFLLMFVTAFIAIGLAEVYESDRRLKSFSRQSLKMMRHGVTPLLLNHVEAQFREETTP